MGRPEDALPSHLPSRAPAPAVSLEGALLTPLLWALLRRPLQPAEELAEDLGLHRATVYRQLSLLCARGLVEGIPCALLGRQSARLYALTPRGIRTIAGGDVHAAAHLARHGGANLAGLAGHLLQVPAGWALRRAAAEVMAAGRRWYAERHRLPTLAAVTLRWQWMPAYQHGFADRRQRAVVRADALLVVHLVPPLESYAIWLLLDPAAGSVPPLQARLLPLLRYREAAERWTQQGAAGDEHFPPLLVLCPSLERALLWRQAAARAAHACRAAAGLRGMIAIRAPRSGDPWPIAAPGMMALTDTFADAPESPPCWLDLEGGQPTTLARLFAMPIPHSALPPGVAALPLLPISSGEAHVWLGGTSARAARAVAAPTGGGVGSQDVRDGKAGSSVSARPLRARLIRSLCRTTVRAPGQRSAPVARQERALCCLELSRSHLSLLAALEAYPGMCVADLAVVLAQARQTVRLRLRALARLELVERHLVPPAPIPPPAVIWAPDPTGAHEIHEIDDALAWWPTPRGRELLALLRSPSWSPSAAGRWARTSMAGGRLGTPSRPPGVPGGRTTAHTSGLNRFFTLLLRQAEERSRAGTSQRLRWWQTGRECYRPYTFAGRTYALCPDAIAEYAWGTRRVRFWVEWDTGSMNRRDLRAKFASYLLYTQSSAWRGRRAGPPCRFCWSSRWSTRRSGGSAR